MLYPIQSMYYRQFLATAGRKSKAQYQPSQQQQVIGNKGQQGEHPAANSA